MKITREWLMRVWGFMPERGNCVDYLRRTLQARYVHVGSHQYKTEEFYISVACWGDDPSAWNWSLVQESLPWGPGSSIMDLKFDTWYTFGQFMDGLRQKDMGEYEYYGS